MNNKEKLAMIEENRKRLAVIKSPYNQLTGEGSYSTPRTKVEIADCPLGTLWLPNDFVDTGFVQALIKYGFKGYISNVLNQGYTEQLYKELYIEFCKERLKYDFEFVCIILYVISDKIKGIDIPFQLNRAQRYYLKELERLRLSGVPIDIVLLKARQWGGSTLTQLYMLWMQLFIRTNWNSVICGQIESQARNVSGMLQKAIDHMPEWLPQIKTSPYQGSQKTRTINLSGSRYSVGSAEKPEGLRSENIYMAHCTEVGLWTATKGKKPEDLVQSIFGSILSGPDTMKILESTAKGIGNYFHRTWLGAVAAENNFTPVFIPWYMIDIYSKPLDHKQYYAFIGTLNEYELWLFSLGATLEAINWYREKKKEMNDAWRMCSEFPSTASEAFQSTGRRVFSIKYVEDLRRTCCKPSIYGDFVGDDKKGKKAFENIRFERIDKPTSTDNVLCVWMLPDKTVNYKDRYVVAVDVGGVSSGADFSSIGVIDKLPMLEVGGVPEVAAEWHGHIEHDLLIWKAAQIAHEYGNALLVIESNTLETDGTEGDNFEYVLDEIVNYYSNLYSRTTPEQIKQGAPVKYGFHTNTKTKPMIVDHMRACMRDFLYIERCEETTFEMDQFELKENGKEMGAVDGCHDDRVMQRCILVYVAWNSPLPHEVIVDNSNINNATRIVSEASI